MEVLKGNRVRIKVVGVGGGGGNAVSRIAEEGTTGLDLLALNTDVQALSQIGAVPTLAIGPKVTNGMGSGGNADIGRKSIRESQDQVAQYLDGADMVFITAGMGGGTGTGAAPTVAEIARKQGALTAAVVTNPFTFEGTLRREVAERGLQQLAGKVDTLICVDNNRLLSSLGGDLSLDKAFQVADEVLRQGVEGITEIVTTSGTINVDFADVKAVMSNGGRSFMAIGEGKGKSAAIDAVQSALANPMFDAPITGAGGLLLNIRGGKDINLKDIEEVTHIIRDASKSDAQVMFGVINDNGSYWKKRIRVTLLATGMDDRGSGEFSSDELYVAQSCLHPVPKPLSSNGAVAATIVGA